MGRVYTISFAGVSVTVAQDLFSYKTVSGKPIILHEVIIMQDGTADMGDAQAESLRFAIKRATGAYTNGSGGTTPTPAPHQTSDTAAGGTTHANDTTRATGGTITTLRVEGANIQSGWYYYPAPEHRIFIAAPGTNPEGLIVGLEVAPADAITLNGSCVIEELG